MMRLAGSGRRGAAILAWGVAAFFAVSSFSVQAARAESAGGESHGTTSSHGGGHELQEFNWFEGFLGESEEYEPSILWRAPGTPVPFGANLINSALLFWVFYRFGKEPVAEALRKRRETILRDMDLAKREREAAEAALHEMEAKIAAMPAQLEALRQELRARGERERELLIADAKERAARLKQDAHRVVEQELKMAHEQLHREMVEQAVAAARAKLERAAGSSDQERLATEYLKQLSQQTPRELGVAR